MANSTQPDPALDRHGPGGLHRGPHFSHRPLMAGESPQNVGSSVLGLGEELIDRGRMDDPICGQAANPHRGFDQRFWHRSQVFIERRPARRGTPRHPVIRRSPLLGGSSRCGDEACYCGRGGAACPSRAGDRRWGVLWVGVVVRVAEVGCCLFATHDPFFNRLPPAKM